MRCTHWKVAGTLALLIALGCSPTPVDGATKSSPDAAQQSSGPSVTPESKWERSCRFTVQVDGGGSETGAVFEGKATANMLGRLPGGAWFLLEPARRRVLSLEAVNVEVDEMQRQAVLKGALPTSGSSIKLSPSGLSFDIAGRWVKVLPMPPLLGEVQAQDFLNLCPEFEDREINYQPNPEMVGRLAQAQKDVTVEVFFGSWCPHCQQVLPRLMKSLRLADNANLQVKWIGLPRSFSTEARVKAREVKGVPTIIVFSEGNELGRFSGTDQVPVEASLAELLR